MNFNKFFPVFVVPFVFACGAFACGVSPGDAADDLEYSADHPEEWCAHEYHSSDQGEVEKVFIHPDKYGITADYGCSQPNGTWTGGYCYLPQSKWSYVKVYTDGQDGTWTSYINNEFGTIRDRMNTRGWNVKKWADGDPDPTLEFHTGTTRPDGSGVLGAADMFGVDVEDDNYGLDQGEYRVYDRCTATLYRTSIEANVPYQNASATAKQRYLKNLWQHEAMHCYGLAHTQGTTEQLMSIVYFINGVWFTSHLDTTAAETQMLTNFDPLN